MATLRILQAIGGLDFSWAPGDLVDLDDDEAAKWADGVRAEYTDHTLPPPPPASPVVQNGDDQDDGDQVESKNDDPPPTLAYDPADQSVKEVLAYLDGVGEQEALHVLQMEENAQAPRKGIVGQRGAILERALANDEARARAEALERAAEASRGGGRGDAIETR